jgi:hypothetical protein
LADQETTAVVSGMVVKIDSEGAQTGMRLGEPKVMDPAAGRDAELAALHARVEALERETAA